MIIMIIDDTISKIRKIEDVLKEKGITFISVYAINPAKKLLQNGEKIDGIVLDMQLPMYAGDKESMRNDGGNFFLKWLSHHNYKIPVLGNSVQEFKTDYQYFKGQMIGVYDAVIFENFITSIKDHN